DWEDEDRMEREEMEFHARVRDAYRQIAASEPERVRLVDASGSVEETHARVMQIVLPFVEARCRTADGLKRMANGPT
ncbi:hypothetical protein OFB63_35155, partial [Escherichia coli]|nr:hypothetical protein [Escherichia coli]